MVGGSQFLFSELVSRTKIYFSYMTIFFWNEFLKNYIARIRLRKLPLQQVEVELFQQTPYLRMQCNSVATGGAPINIREDTCPHGWVLKMPQHPVYDNVVICTVDGQLRLEGESPMSVETFVQICEVAI